MKHNIIAVLLVALFSTTSCQAQTQQRVNATTVSFLIDLTDPVIYTEIRSDLEENLNTFFTNAGLSSIKFGQKLSVRMGAIDESGKLTFRTSSIALLDKSVSKKTAKKQSDPRPLVQLIASELDRYQKISEQKNESSLILETILKSFRELDSNSREIVVIETDGIEHSQYSNFYKAIPTTEQNIDKLLSNLDPLLLEEARTKITEVAPEIVFVLKSNPKVKTADLKMFYSIFLTRIGVNPHNIRFIDNLSNNTNL